MPNDVLKQMGDKSKSRTRALTIKKNRENCKQIAIRLNERHILDSLRFLDMLNLWKLNFRIRMRTISILLIIKGKKIQSQEY